MDIAGYHVPTLMGAGATFASVYAAFARFDHVQSRANRRFVSRWLLGNNITSLQFNWEASFVELFTNFFGERHFSIKCFLRSAMLSTFLISVALTWVAVKYVKHFDNLVKVESALRIFLIFLFGITSDYFSLWKTRLLLMTISRFNNILILAMIPLDILLTSILYFGMFIVPDYVSRRENIVQVIYEWIQVLWRYPADLSLLFVPLYAVALMTSAWIWAYLIVAYLLRGLSFIPGFLTALSKIMDIQEHPVRSIGWVAAAISAIGVGIVGAL